MPETRMGPVCLTLLEPRPFGDLLVDACPRFAGIFFDAGKIVGAKAEGFDQLEDAMAPAGHVVDITEPRKCPKCRCTMTMYWCQYNSPIKLDSCPTCDGIWVDDGELRQMAEFCH